MALPFFRQQQQAVTPPEQLQVKKIPQRLDLVANCGLSHKQRLCRLGKLR